MYSSVFCVFATVLVLVQSKTHHHKKRCDYTVSTDIGNCVTCLIETHWVYPNRVCCQVGQTRFNPYKDPGSSSSLASDRGSGNTLCRKPSPQGVNAETFKSFYVISRVPKATDISYFNCPAVRSVMIDVTMNATCKPHYRHVPLKPMPTQTFNPSVVSVRRCDGNCPGFTCMPSRLEMIKVPIRVTNRSPSGDITSSCAIVEVEEHTNCKCKCKQEKNECNERQDWVRNRCACECKNQETMKRNCEAELRMLWNDEDCTCNCTEMDIECTSGQEWNREKCDCVFKQTDFWSK